MRCTTPFLLEDDKLLSVWQLFDGLVYLTVRYTGSKTKCSELFSVAWIYCEEEQKLEIHVNARFLYGTGFVFKLPFEEGG